ncbi:molybdate ABC transporter ATP-binding protein ModF [Bermanella marisrubri]|uniref:ABC molybdenum transporter, ATP-binding subunit modF n=1 Tax=Bermanella marisrubri TaxID=207949 RepID=Q1N2C8_9GAMM|nr:molybdate ABC transporter ATP-binding protein ModF [Bermanella marisrubri]EAT12479.1 ABC molybdenum transporter, ATP-binding subunit modF [Oceanobacter sp. RED65] [Bermanella marisrubri]QIZ85556.1 molybdate ABC transporter ATP-binding protein ModF [Bermanella marisrubri]
MSAHYHQAYFSLDSHTRLLIPDLNICDGESWAFIGSNGSGKSVFAKTLNQTLENDEGHFSSDHLGTATVSLEEQQFLIDREAERDESDITNEVFHGTPVIELLREISNDSQKIKHLVNVFSLAPLLNTGFRKLSTGESRKVILLRALLSNSKTLIFDEPYEGLDRESQVALSNILHDLHQQGRTLILIVNRLDEVPIWCSNLGVLHNLTLIAQGHKSAVLNDQRVKAFFKFNAESLVLPDRDPCSAVLNLDQQQPLVKLHDGRVAYSDKLIFEHLSWRIEQGEHWTIQGPNGCGKSTLLNLITGDHPQCYVNDLQIFGIKRGSGESIWDIKQHIGIISAALQWQYKATTNVLSAVVSGLFDSIGLYSQVDDHQKNIALSWLKQVKLAHKANEPLHQLSYGEQRLVLICRAMIKQPALLILDEPCQGLDEINRQLVLGFIELLAQQKNTTLLYVTHHEKDILNCFQNRLICTDITPNHGSQWRILRRENSSK